MNLTETSARICLVGGLAVKLSVILFGGPVSAQIIPDATLGTEGSRVTEGVDVQGGPSDRIDGGAVRGTNLFHSFQEFNVLDGQQVYFANPAGIDNILSRVTGNNGSDILGTLGVLGSANLFLVNPNGIVFGPNARLDVAGSFVASTGHGFNFPDGSTFSATNPQAPPLLTINLTPGLQRGTQPLEEINNAGNLEVGAGQTLALYGGDVTSTGSLRAPGGTVMMLGDRIGLLDNARIDVSSETGGGTVLIGGGFQGKGTVSNATRTFVDAGVQIEADALSTGDGGNVIIWADEVTGFYGNISARGGTEAGNGGFVEVSGKEQLIFRGNVETNAVNGEAGTLLLDPTDIIIANGSADSAADGDDTFAGNNSGNAGEILTSPINDTAPTTIYESELEGLAGDTNIVLQATNNITIEDLADDALDFQAGGGRITFTADADFDGVGSVVMEDTTSDTLFTNGRGIEISGASLTLGDINTAFIAFIGDDQPTQEVVVNINEGGSIPDATFENNTFTPGTTSFLFSVSEEGFIRDLDVRFSAEHTFDSDLSVSLESPQGTRLNLFANVGNDGQNFQDTRLDDEAPTSINEGTAPFRGIFSPVGRLAIFDGENSNGDWTLTITDTAPADDGRLFEAGETAPWGTATGTQLIFELVTTQPNNPVDRNSGSITLNATNGNISAGNLNAENSFGAGGKITLEATGNIATAGVNSSSFASSGNGGAIILDAGGNLSAGLIESYSFSVEENSGNGGAIILDAVGNLSVELIESSSFSVEGNSENGGAIALNTGGNVSVGRISSFSSSIEGNSGKGGAIALNAGGNASVGGISSFSSSIEGNSGNGGAIALNAGSNLSAEIIETFSFSSFNGESGNGGIVHINAGTVRLINSFIDTVSLNSQGGNVTIAATESNPQIPAIQLVNTSIDVTTRSQGKPTNSTAFGKTGDVTIEAVNGGAVELIGTNSIDSDNPPLILTAALANAENETTGGDLTIRGGSVTIEGYELSANVNEGVTGNGGDILIETPANGDITISNNAIISTTTLGDGKAGDLLIRTGNLRVEENARLEAIAGSGNDSGDTGDAITKSQGDGGNITLTVTDAIEVRNANISTESQSNSFGRAGDISIEANSLRLNRGTLTADTIGDVQAQRQGGANINTIKIELSNFLLMENESLISAGANENANGGNIIIDTPLLVVLQPTGPDGSDIIASAFEGNGGTITITAQGIFGVGNRQASGVVGIEQRKVVKGNRTNDIDASSELGASGEVDINRAFDPSPVLRELSTQTAAPQLDQTCSPSGKSGRSEFTVTGRDGLPPSPTDTLSPERTLADLGTPIDSTASQETTATLPPSPSRIVEAQGWTIDEEGNVILTAHAPTVNSQGQWQPQVSCQGER